MAKFSSLQAPITNQKANNRIADTQAIQNRALVGAVQPGTNINQVAQQAGAQSTAQASQQALQEQGQQAQLAGAQQGQQLQQQQLANQKQLGQQNLQFQKAAQEVDQKLFNINRDAAREEANQRRAFIAGQINRDFLNEQELADWALFKAKDQEDLKNKIATMERMHDRKAAYDQHIYNTAIQELQQKEKTADRESKQEIQEMIAKIKQKQEEKAAARAAEASNRRAMWGAMDSVGNALIMSGNPYAMAAGGGMKVISAVGQS